MTLIRYLLIYTGIHLTLFALLKLASYYPYETLTLVSYIATGEPL